jgi:hypothetical protein
MRRIWTSIRIHRVSQLPWSAITRTGIVVSQSCRYYFLGTFVNCFTGFCRSHNSCMSTMSPLAKLRHTSLRLFSSGTASVEFKRTHFRLQIISGDFRGVFQNSFFTSKEFLYHRKEKKVTGYFSVSAILIWVLLCFLKPHNVSSRYCLYYILLHFVCFVIISQCDIIQIEFITYLFMKVLRKRFSQFSLGLFWN